MARSSSFSRIPFCKSPEKGAAHQYFCTDARTDPFAGGKTILSDLLRQIIYDNGKQGGVYIEPFAGGAGAALRLIMDGHVDRILINDADRAVFSFWNCVINRTTDLVKKIEKTPLTITEWKNQRRIYASKVRNQLDLGFSAFYLNRCNRSGIIKNAGPIGGMEQTGEWKIDVRFNREELVRRIEEIAEYGNRIIISNREANALISQLPKVVGGEKIFIYADPPYYVKGRELYLSHFNPDQHAALAAEMRKVNSSWIMTYDDVKQTRDLYSRETVIPFSLRYSAHHSSPKGGEILIIPGHVKISQSSLEILSGFRAQSAVSLAA